MCMLASLCAYVCVCVFALCVIACVCVCVCVRPVCNCMCVCVCPVCTHTSVWRSQSFHLARAQAHSLCSSIAAARLARLMLHNLHLLLGESQELRPCSAHEGQPWWGEEKHRAPPLNAAGDATCKGQCLQPPINATSPEQIVKTH